MARRELGHQDLRAGFINLPIVREDSPPPPPLVSVQHHQQLRRHRQIIKILYHVLLLIYLRHLLTMNPTAPSGLTWEDTWDLNNNDDGMNFLPDPSAYRQPSPEVRSPTDNGRPSPLSVRDGQSRAASFVDQQPTNQHHQHNHDH